MKRVALLAMLAALGACGERQATEAAGTPETVEPEAPAISPPAPTPAPAPAAVVLPTIDEAAIMAALTPDQTLEVVAFGAAGTATKEGTIEGYKAKVWAVPVARGQTLAVTFEPSNTNLYMNVADAADTRGAAIFVGEQAGTKAEIVAAKDGVYLIKPYQPRAMARRAEKGSYKLTIERK